MIVSSLIGLVVLVWTIIGLVYLFREQRWFWGILGLFLPVIPMAYAVYCLWWRVGPPVVAPVAPVAPIVAPVAPPVAPASPIASRTF